MARTQKPHCTTQKHVEHQDATNIQQKQLFVCVIRLNAIL